MKRDTINTILAVLAIAVLSLATIRLVVETRSKTSCAVCKEHELYETELKRAVATYRDYWQKCMEENDR